MYPFPTVDTTNDLEFPSLGYEMMNFIFKKKKKRQYQLGSEEKNTVLAVTALSITGTNESQCDNFGCYIR